MAATSTALLDGLGGERLLPFAAALLLVALITPVLGMSLDGRFAERIPGHGHVGTVEVGHVHDFTRSHVSGGLGTHEEMGERSPAVSGPVLVEYAPDVLAGGVTLTPAAAPPSPPALAPPPLLSHSWRAASSTTGLPPRLPRLRPGLSASPIRFTSAA